VDGKPNNRWQDAMPTGGKTNVCAQAGRHVVDTRFHTSERFDLAEAKQDAPYSRPEVDVRGDWYGLYTVESRADAVAVGSAYPLAPRFRWECLTRLCLTIEEWNSQALFKAREALLLP
jgi:hypothetical protein